MALEHYSPESSHEFYRDYYNEQVGSGLQVYGGRKIMPQAGAGIGSIFSGLLRAVAPVAKNIGKNLGKRALATGARIAGDVIGGQNFKSAVGRRVRDTGKDLLSDMSWASMPDVNKRRAVVTASRKRKRTAGSARSGNKRKRNIFD